MKKELSFSEMLQKNIDKHNKKQRESIELMKKYANKDGLINLSDLSKPIDKEL